MKISVNWLNDYVHTDLAPEKIADILSDLGFPCEGIDNLDDDTVIDIEVTSNRGDCLSYIGIARELAAVTGSELKIPEVTLDCSDKLAADLVSVEIAEPELCFRYTARVIEGVKVGPSPDWMKKRLEAIGMRSVNNIVDATNYALAETGQPPHAFDYDKIKDKKIIVRKARAGERVTSIDGTKCDLQTDLLIIADAQGPVAIAGVMGGLETEVSETTTTILLEDAYFDPVTVRTASRRLALPSDAAFRFERIVDTEMIDAASARTAQLIIQVAGGKVARSVVDTYPKKPETKQVTLRLSRLNALLGIEVAPDTALDILASLSFAPQRQGDVITCTVPSWRKDIYREVDLIEEVARVHGYDNIPTAREIKIEVAPVDPRQRLVKAIGTFLNGCGCYETINVTFVDDSTSHLFTGRKPKDHLAVKNVSRKSANLLRQSLLGSLCAVLETNLNAKNTPCRVFEIADTFVPSAEKTKLALVCDGDFRQLRGIVEGLIKTIAPDADITFKPAELIWAQAGAEVFVNDTNIGAAGIFSQPVKDKFNFKQVSPCGVELDFQSLSDLQAGPVKVKPIPRYPAIARDLSIVVDENVTWSDIAQAVNKKAAPELEDIMFVGIYRGKGIAENKKSVTLSLCFRDEDGTLTHETVDGFESKIVKSLTESVKAELRTLQAS